MRNQESTACNPKSKTVLHILTLGQVKPSCCVGCPVLVLELKSCMLCPSCDIEISPVRQDYQCFQCCYYTIFKGYIICRIIIKGFLIHEQVKANADKIKLQAHSVNLSKMNVEPRYGYLPTSIVVACLRSNCQFFMPNRRMSRIVLSGIKPLLASSAQPKRRQKRENNKKATG